MAPQAAAKEFQLILYGATGFTGGLAAKYLAKSYPELRWAIAGRNAEKLRKVLETLAPAKPGVVTADGADQEALDRMAASTEVVITTAGPFSRYGSKLVAACVKNGTHYCDITGELGWVREMIATHDQEARRTGANIVHLCGCDCIPWDLCTLALADKVREKDGEELTRVEFYDTVKGSLSGGTLETMMHIMFGGEKKPQIVADAHFDPILSLPSQTKSEYGVVDKNVRTVDFGSSRCLFMMSDVNKNAVRRSNALLGYGRRVEYSEGLDAKNPIMALLTFLMFATFGLLIVFPPTRYVLRKFVLPKPGEGPSEEQMLSSYLTIVGKATGSRGSHVSAEMKFHVDAGYMDTARMLAESGLALVLDKDKIAARGGVYTPAACQGRVLLDRLIESGTSFSIKEA